MIQAESYGWLELIYSILILCLAYNTVFAYCYGWSWLGINTCSLKNRSGKK
jgi:hypothetical protein